jgi:hypothetical protein
MRVRASLVMMLLAALLHAGCATQFKTWNYSWGRIVAVDGNTLAKICTPKPAKWDNGTPRRKWTVVLGCFDPSDNTIYIEDSCQGAQVLPHEMAHLDGIHDPKAAGYDW